MKEKYTFVIMIIGAAVYSLGVLLKITHAPGADKLLLSGKIIGGIGLLLLIYTVFKPEKKVK